jgi:hypothetical protein
LNQILQKPIVPKKLIKKKIKNPNKPKLVKKFDKISHSMINLEKIGKPLKISIPTQIKK